ncbi:MAG: M23 family metallopeptidase [Elusimicrobia bacterium]|nr:M23 family metallopeptidase [Elusimicrobiota bacterium]
MTFNQAAALMDPTLLRRAVENVAQFQDSGSYAASEPEIRSILEKEGVVAKPGRPKPKAEPKPAPPGWNGTFDSPLRAGVITSPFGVDRGDHRHTGLDIAAGSGTPILASAPGTVIHAAWTGGYGNLVIVRHGESVTTYYAHASAFKARKGDAVRQGQTVALVGSTGNSTGPHVHFEIRVGSTPTDPCKRLRRC